MGLLEEDIYLEAITATLRGPALQAADIGAASAEVALAELERSMVLEVMKL